MHDGTATDSTGGMAGAGPTNWCPDEAKSVFVVFIASKEMKEYGPHSIAYVIENYAGQEALFRYEGEQEWQPLSRIIQWRDERRAARNAMPASKRMLAKLTEFRVPFDASRITRAEAKALYDSIPEVRNLRQAKKYKKDEARATQKAEYAAKVRQELMNQARELGFSVDDSTSDAMLEEMQEGMAEDEEIAEFHSIINRLGEFSIIIPLPKNLIKNRIMDAIEQFGVMADEMEQIESHFMNLIVPGEIARKVSTDVIEVIKRTTAYYCAEKGEPLALLVAGAVCFHIYPSLKYDPSELCLSPEEWKRIKRSVRKWLVAKKFLPEA